MDRLSSRPVNPSDFLAQIIKEKEKLVVHPGTSQYTIGGVSACGLASLNFARLVLDKEREGIRGAALLADIASVQAVEVSGVDRVHFSRFSWFSRISSPSALNGGTIFISKSKLSLQRLCFKHQ